MKCKEDNLVQIGVEQRRRFLRLFGTAAAMLPITVVIGCSDDTPSTTTNESRATDQNSPSNETQPSGQEQMAQQEMQSGAEQTRDNAEQTADGGTDQAYEDMEKLSLDNPTARSLGYKHDAANVDFDEYPQRARPEASNHYCSNCALYTKPQSGDWGPCTLFPGKLVSADGWCSAYAPRPA